MGRAISHAGYGTAAAFRHRRSCDYISIQLLRLLLHANRRQSVFPREGEMMAISSFLSPKKSSGKPSTMLTLKIFHKH